MDYWERFRGVYPVILYREEPNLDLPPLRPLNLRQLRLGTVPESRAADFSHEEQAKRRAVRAELPGAIFECSDDCVSSS